MPHRVIKFKRVGKTEKIAVVSVSAGRSAQTQTVITSDICRFFGFVFLMMATRLWLQTGFRRTKVG